VLGWTAQHFEKKGVDAPRLTSEVLLAHVLQCSRVKLYVDLDRPLEAQELATYRALIARRLGGEPTQYLTGTREFYGRAFLVDSRVLVPRPETELLVDEVLALVPRFSGSDVLDLCTGSGCIAITVAAERPLARVVAVDLFPGACEVALANARAHAVASRVEVLEGDLFSPLPAGARFDLVVSNPPYVARPQIPGLPPEVRREPVAALDGGPDGLDFYRRIIPGARDRLRPGGWLALEIGETQGAEVCRLLQGAGYEEVRIGKDWERRDRHAFARMPAGGEPRAG